MKHYDAYLFDWDGTVAQTLAVWIPIVRKTLRTYGIEADDKEIVLKIMGRAIAALPELGVPQADLPAVFAEWDRVAVEQIPQAPFYPDVLDVLRLLKTHGKRTAIITATIGNTMQVVLDAHNLHDMFDVVVTGNDVTAHKPDPEGILMALARLGVAKDRAVMLGDSEKDILAAHNAGIDSVLFFPRDNEAFHTLGELAAHKPTYIIHSWRELLNQVQSEVA
jgi:HAD superfamily hydrolase (TIGR01509 family)